MASIARSDSCLPFARPVKPMGLKISMAEARPNISGNFLPLNHSLGFAGREKEIMRLRELYSARKCVLLVGPAGVGKTALLQQIRQQSSMFLCEETSSLTRIFDCLEQQLAWEHNKMKLVERKNRLLRHLGGLGEPVVLDHLAFTTPRDSLPV
jgi:AAA ATPase domain